MLHEDHFVDPAPAQGYATLLNDGVYHCDECVMYRLLAAPDKLRERCAQRRHPAYTTPKLIANAPKLLWIRDITKLNGPITRSWYHLYVILDVFRRFLWAGWSRQVNRRCSRSGLPPPVVRANRSDHSP